MNGKICYIEMPAADVQRSAEFYAKVFGWRLRPRGDGHTGSKGAIQRTSLLAAVRRTVSERA